MNGIVKMLKMHKVNWFIAAQWVLLAAVVIPGLFLDVPKARVTASTDLVIGSFLGGLLMKEIKEGAKVMALISFLLPLSHIATRLIWNV